MEGFKTSATNLKAHATGYAKTYLEIVKAKATLSASSAAAGAAIGIVAFLFTLFFLIFFFAGLALWIGSAINSYAAGFFIVAGLFLLVVVVIFALRKKVIVPFIRNTIISKVYE